MDAIIYQNPGCGTWRTTLARIRDAGIEPHVIEHLEAPPSRAMSRQLGALMGIALREAVREKAAPCAELGLDNPDPTDGRLLDAMMAHPILINRPIVVTPTGARLCRPSELVLDLVP
jgi:arsenate reductase